MKTGMDAMRESGRQDGQALAESLVVMGVLASLWLGLAWLGRLQDAALHLAHASRHAAFAWAHQGLDEIGAAATDAGAQKVWQTRQGGPLLPEGMSVALDVLPQPLSGLPGDSVPGAGGMRRELRLGEEQIRIARAAARTAGGPGTQGRLRDFDRLAVSLRRHTAILSGSGAVSGDAEVQRILGGSTRAWGHAAQPSQSLGRSLTARLAPVDAAWGRPPPVWDWLGAWAGRVPQRHLHRGAP
ncbi:MAG TPA: hypothetical protein VFM22_07475 [Castellaniella sp.]|jgi:hypothetical protein|nr:hypothetical protein [Castellaniella sp.]